MGNFFGHCACSHHYQVDLSRPRPSKLAFGYALSYRKWLMTNNNPMVSHLGFGSSLTLEVTVWKDVASPPPQTHSQNFLHWTHRRRRKR